jgi:hypothetical protein
MAPPDDYGDDPNAPPLTETELDASIRRWCFWTSILFAIALAVIVYGRITGAGHFF